MIATDRRGQGLARAIVGHALDAMAERGEAISSLFPTTATLYRSLGYEIDGTCRVQRVPIDELPTGDGSIELEPTDFDAVDVRSVANRAGIDHDGWLVRGDVDHSWPEYRRRHRSTSGDVFVGRRDGAVALVRRVDRGHRAEGGRRAVGDASREIGHLSVAELCRAAA